MEIGSFGCSFLHGSDLSDLENYNKTWVEFRCSKLTYPALIAKQLGVGYYCTALPAQSNKVIADDVLRAVRYRGNSLFYIINWTWIDRYEYIGNDTRFFSGYPGWQQIVPTDNTDISKSYYKYFYSDLDAKLQNLMYINTVLSALQNNNCKFIMTNTDYLLFDKQYHCPASIDYLQNNLLPYVGNFDGKNFLDWAIHNGFEISKYHHPLEQAHQAASEYWLPTVVQMLNTHTTED